MASPGRRAARDAGLARIGPAAHSLCQRAWIHPYRIAADDGAPLRRIVGLPAIIAIRAVRPLRKAAGVRAFRRSVPPGQYRRHPRLGAGTLSDRRAWVGAL